MQHEQYFSLIFQKALPREVVKFTSLHKIFHMNSNVFNTRVISLLVYEWSTNELNDWEMQQKMWKIYSNSRKCFLTFLSFSPIQPLGYPCYTRFNPTSNIHNHLFLFLLWSSRSVEWEEKETMEVKGAKKARKIEMRNLELFYKWKSSQRGKKSLKKKLFIFVFLVLPVALDCSLNLCPFCSVTDALKCSLAVGWVWDDENWFLIQFTFEYIHSLFVFSE